VRGNSGSSLAPGPLPPNEAERLSTVRRYDILDTPRDGAFDRIARLAARFLRAPIATVTIVDEDRIWFKTSHGLDVDQIDRLPGLCASAILQDDCYVVTDAAIDPRTLTNPLVTGELGLRFYAAAPLVTHDGYRLGTINVIDRLPRLISEQETATLFDLAALVVDELELRLAARNFLRAKQALARLGEAVQQGALPPAIPSIPGMDLASLYRPARKGLEICGDFYDVFQTQNGSWVVFIGDVCGKGVDAAVMMSSVKHRLRALAEAGHTPSQVLARLNESLIKESMERFCSVCYLELTLKPGGSRAVISSGGHPLPLFRRANGAVEEVGTSGVLIGAFPTVEVTDTSIDCADGDVLLLYTDGVVERRGTGDLEATESTLRSTLRSCGNGNAALALQTLWDAMPEWKEGQEDDAAMLLLKVIPSEGNARTGPNPRTGS